MKEIENDSTQAYRTRAQEEAIANAIGDGCLSKVNINISAAIQEIDNILRSCYVTGGSVTPLHSWYSDDKGDSTGYPTTSATTSTTQITTAQPIETTPDFVSENF